MTNQKEKRKVPELRFPEFSGEWELKKLSEIAEIIMGQSPDSKNYTSDSNEMILVQGNADMKNGKVFPRIYTREVTKTAEIGDILLSVRAPVGEIGRTDNKVCIGRGISAIKGNNFIYYLLDKYKTYKLWNKYIQGSTFESINSNDIKELSINIPTNKEQQKIGEFFSKLDRQIELEEKKLVLLEEQKKGYMQKIFSQELRFKDENGEEYPKWEEVSLNNISSIKTGHDNVQDSVSNGRYHFFDRSSEIKYINHFIYDEKAIIYPGEGSKFLPRYFEGKYSLHQRAYSIYNITINDKYLYYYLQTKNNHFIKYAVGSTVKSLRMNAFVKLSVMLPSEKEQEKISLFLSSLEKRYEFLKLKIDMLNILKKSLLNSIFL